MQAFAFPVFRECSFWASRNGVEQIFFDINQKIVCWKICKVSVLLAVLWEYVFQNVEWVEVWAKRYGKMIDVLSLLLALRLSARKSEIKG